MEAFAHPPAAAGAAVAAAGAGDGGFRSRFPPPAPFAYIAVLTLSYLGFGSLVQAVQLPLGLLWSQAFLFLWPSWQILRRAGFRPLTFVRADRLPRLMPLVLAISGCAFLCASGTMALLQSLVPDDWLRNDVPQLLTNESGVWSAVLYAGVIAGAPLAEETVFRGCLLPMLAARMPLRRAVLWQAILFSLIHLDPVGFLPRLVLGLAFGWLWVGSGSLWATIFAHALNNGLSSAILLFAGDDRLEEATGIDQLMAAAIAAGAGLAMVAGLRWLARAPQRQALPDTDPTALGLPLTAAESRRALRGYAAASFAGLAALAAAARL